jgi:hypothetical protein
VCKQLKVALKPAPGTAVDLFSLVREGRAPLINGLKWN